MHCYRLLLTVFLLASCGGIASPLFAAETQKIEQGGVAMEFAFDPQDSSGAALVNLTLRDAASGNVLQGAQPAAWMVARRSEQVSDELSCADKANQLSVGSLGARADVDMNAYRLVTLNQDSTVAFINPLVRLKNSKLESIVQLPSAGYDWAFAPRLQRLVVSLRDVGSLAIIDTATRQLLTILPLGEGSLPTRLVLDPDGKRLWVGLDGRPEIALIDLNANKETMRIAVGSGLHTLVADADTPWLFVTNSESNTVTLIDRASLKPAAQVVVAQTPVAAAWSVAAQRLVVIGANGGRLDLIDPTKPKLTAELTLSRGITALSLFDNGRYALVANALSNDVSLIDLAAPKLLDALKLVGKPDQITQAGDFAYLRSQASAQIHVVSLTQAKLGKLQSVIVPMGRLAPQEAPEAINDAASMMTAAPEGNGILLANAPDGYIYRYVEGMMAPVGSFSNYRRQARALRVLDDSLNEREAGHYQATVRMPHSGRYDVIVRNLRPAITACFTTNVNVATAALPLVAPAPIPKLISVRALAGNVLAVEFSLQAADKAGNKSLITDVQDVVLLGVQRGGQWQGRSLAHAITGGRYQALFAGVPAAEIELLVQAPSQQVWFTQGRIGHVRWPLVNDLTQNTDARLAVGERDASPE
jgi:YVTN family beta-propeller protein